MPAHPTEVLASWLRRARATGLLALLAAVPARAQTTQTVNTAPKSGITIQVTDVYNGVPARGFLPLRVSITNSSNNDGVWEIQTEAAFNYRSDGHFGALATCPVPANQTHVFEVLAPLPSTDSGGEPRVIVHVTGPGSANADVQFTANVQPVPPSSLNVIVPTTAMGGFTGTATFGRGGRGSPGPTTSIVSSGNGTITRTTTIPAPDGSTSEIMVITNPDGSMQTTTTIRNSSGQITSAPRASTAPATSAAPTTAHNADGSATTSRVTTQPDGSTRTESVTNNPDGTYSVVVQDASGRNLGGGTGGGFGFASSGTIPGQQLMAIVDALSHPLPTPNPAVILSGNVSLSGNTNGNTTPLGSVAITGGNLIINGAPLSYSTGASLQNGAIQLNNGTLTITGNAIVFGNTTSNATSGGGSGSVVISNGGSLIIGGAVAPPPYAMPPPPPPPPPPPILTAIGPSTTSRGTVVTRATGRRGVSRSYSRVAGPAIFVGLSPTLSHDQGDRIKNYFNTIYLRPLQQSSLDPDLLSADWRAYLGFDWLFYTAADWLAAPPGVRLAITQWVAVGGDLRLVANSDGGLDLPPRQDEHYGAGRIELFTEDELAQYNFTAEHSNPDDRFLFSLAYQPAPPAPSGMASFDIPAGFERREFTVSLPTITRLITLDLSSVVGTVPGLNGIVENALKNSFTNSGVVFSTEAKLSYNASTLKITVTNTPQNLDLIANFLQRYGEPDGVVVGVGPDLLAPPAVPAKLADQKFEEAAPRLGNQYAVVAMVVVCFCLFVGPLNLFWFCHGARRPHLLWVTPLLAIVASVAILAFILLAEGIGGRGLYFRVTQLLPPAIDGKFAVESEVESAVTGLLTHRDFELANPAWILDYGPDGLDQSWEHGDFWQSGPHYTGDWFVSRRAQVLVARAVVPSRAALHVTPAAVVGQPPVLTSEYNDWMENLFYLDPNGLYWKVARISDGQPTPLQPATAAEVVAAWSGILRSAPPALADSLRRLAPRPGAFFALGNGGNPALEPQFPGLRWVRFSHVITGQVIP
jgi:hypothetical protein